VTGAADDVIARINAEVEAWESGPDAAWWDPGCLTDPEPSFEGMRPRVLIFDELASFVQSFGLQMELVLVPALNSVATSSSSATSSIREFEHVLALGLMKAYRVRPHHLGIRDMGCFCHPAPFPAARDYRRRTKHRNRRRR